MSECPKCGSIKIAEILYGMPTFSEELQTAMDKGQVVLGGCCIRDDDPSWRCVECNFDIFGNQILEI